MREEQGAWPEGLKRTRPREQVMAVLMAAGRPMSAMDLCVEIEKNGNSAWLSTVYRVLESFEQAGVVSRIALPGGDQALYELRVAGHRHYALCTGCHRVIPMDNCPVEHFAPSISEEGFRVTGHSVEIYGQCKNCRERSGQT
jgi:Fur family ferric uptake transcriptional regulator